MLRAGVAAGLIGGAAQVAIAFMGFAIGGMSATILLLALDAAVGIAGAALVAKSRWAGIGLMLAAGVGAAFALFWTTWLEIGVAALLLVAVAATAYSLRSVRG